MISQHNVQAGGIRVDERVPHRGERSPHAQRATSATRTRPWWGGRRRHGRWSASDRQSRKRLRPSPVRRLQAGLGLLGIAFNPIEKRCQTTRPVRVLSQAASRVGLRPHAFAWCDVAGAGAPTPSARCLLERPALHADPVPLVREACGHAFPDRWHRVLWEHSGAAPAVAGARPVRVAVPRRSGAAPP
jgi:hypothetical protein